MKKEKLNEYIRQTKNSIDSLEEGLTTKDKKKIAVELYNEYLALSKAEKEKNV